MRMWMVEPEVLCRKHLLGEHVELHMLVGSLARGIRIDNFVRNNLIQPQSIAARHEALVQEMARRGYRHASPLGAARLDHLPTEHASARVEGASALRDLVTRCADCRARHKIFLGNQK